MSRVTKTADVLGRLLLGWYLIGTARYFWTGRFRVELGQLRQMFEAPMTMWTVLAPLQLCIARRWRIRGYSPTVARHMGRSHRWVAVLVLGLSHESPVVCRSELVRHFTQR